MTLLKRAVRKLGGRVIDRRTTLGRTLARWRAELIDDLGGREMISAQQLAVVELAVTTKLLLDSIDAWLLNQPSLINQRKRALLPVVRERQQLVDSLARLLLALGLDRREKRPLDLTQYLTQRRATFSSNPPREDDHDDAPPAHPQGSDERH